MAAVAARPMSARPAGGGGVVDASPSQAYERDRLTGGVIEAPKLTAPPRPRSAFRVPFDSVTGPRFGDGTIDGAKLAHELIFVSPPVWPRLTRACDAPPGATAPPAGLFFWSPRAHWERKQVREHHRTADVSYKEAMDKLGLGDYRGALDLLDVAIRSVPDDAKYMFQASGLAGPLFAPVSTHPPPPRTRPSTPFFSFFA